MVRRWSLDDGAEGAELAASTAAALAKRITELWNTEEYLGAVVHGASSSVIQGLLTPTLVSLGYKDEVGYKVVDAGFKPDFMSACGRVMVEVERGKTLDNNMDMLDMWKCHIHPTAKHLILLVPIWYVKQGGRSATFSRVCRRLAAFFEKGCETNVASLHLAGY